MSDTKIRELAGKLSTTSFARKHPQDALDWLVENEKQIIEAFEAKNGKV